MSDSEPAKRLPEWVDEIMPYRGQARDNGDQPWAACYNFVGTQGAIYAEAYALAFNGQTHTAQLLTEIAKFATNQADRITNTGRIVN